MTSNALRKLLGDTERYNNITTRV